MIQVGWMCNDVLMFQSQAFNNDGVSCLYFLNVVAAQKTYSLEPTARTSTENPLLYKPWISNPLKLGVLGPKTIVKVKSQREFSLTS